MIPYLFRFFKGMRSAKKISKKIKKILKKVLTNENESDIIYTVSERDTNLSEKKS